LGAKIDVRDGAGNTAMTLACKQGHVHVMHMLAQRGATMALRDNSQHTLLHWAVYMVISMIAYLKVCQHNHLFHFFCN
jgi:ankyrin repeat protein